MNSIVRFFLENKIFVAIAILIILAAGASVAPFAYRLPILPHSPVPVDAIPNIGENQQIVFTEWPGRSPQDIEDQITYPLTTSLLGVPGVKTIRSVSDLGYSSIYLIFKDDVEFYWSRTRVLEKLSSLPSGILPEGVSPTLGPDATALGQVFWYTLEGRDDSGNPAGGWDLHEIRSIQDWFVRYALQGVEGVSEVASIGGHVKEYQVDLNPAAMRAYGVGLLQVVDAVRKSNIDVGARTIEVNSVEYVIRGLGFIKSISDLERAVVAVRGDSVPILLKDVAHVNFGPALRRGALDKAGVEAVGGVVVVRYGENPLAVIKRVKDKITEISPGLPQKTLAGGRVSKLTVVPFYDRTGLIYETLDTLSSALNQEILVTVIVIIVMVLHLQSAVLISAILPLGVLIAFILMKLWGIDANIVALSGIAIAIGTMVDMGIVLCENILVHLREAPSGKNRLETIFEATVEVAGALTTAFCTTVVSFFPVFALESAEGKLFGPLAYTKTFSLIGALFVALIIIPPLAHLLFRGWAPSKIAIKLCHLAVIPLGILLGFFYFFPGAVLLSLGLIQLSLPRLEQKYSAL
ncbi:MAG: efflux RND transporter permease subunit, partial [Deltaproteobacteria bacterium]|nr:efflux RND transporter permease subunit [Deltaproteobacteria bacterium]